MNRTIFYNGQVVTMDEACPAAQAVLVENGKIVSVGSNDEIRALANDDTQMRDLNGQALLPGFIDPHSHLTAVAYTLLMVNLAASPGGDCDTIEQVVDAFKKRLTEEEFTGDEWMMGMGYDNSIFENSKHPTKHDLDAVSTEIPIACIHVSGHCAVLNTKGLEQVGYVGDYTVPQGGTVECYPGTNEPTGLITESALTAPEIQAKMKAPDIRRVLGSIKTACSFYSSFGITTAQDARLRNDQYMLLSNAAKIGAVNIDVVGYVDSSMSDTLLPKDGDRSISYENHVRIGGYKDFFDGSPQAKTAWLSEPYYEVPEGKAADYCGFPAVKDEDAYASMKLCLENNWQINVHCNGDAACEQMIVAYEKALADTGIKTDLRPVMVHAQTVREDQLDRMQKMGMIVTFFLDHVYYWGDYHYESVLGPERAQRISPIRSAINRGINFTMHQDAPIVKPNALFAVHNAVNRLTKKGRLLGADQRITVEEALKGITINGAYQIFEEDQKGSITPGKIADLVILDKNPLLVPSEAIRDIQIVETFKDGQTIYTA